jgi:hypothetical protein
MIRWVLFLLLLALLPSCTNTGYQFAAVQMVTGSQDGAQFDVWIGSNIAQTVRRNWAWNPSFQDVAHQSAVLIERLSGCEVRWITGDASVQTLGLACNGAPAAPTPRRKSVFTCDSHEYRNGLDALVCQF